MLGFAGATGSLIFAAVRDQLTHAPTGADNRVMSTVRLGFSLGFMTGPILGSVVGGVAGLRLTLIAAGVCTLLQAVPMIGQTVNRAVPDLVVSPDGARPTGTCRDIPSLRAAADVPRPERAGDVWRHHQVRLPADLHGAAARHSGLAARCGDLGPVGRDAGVHSDHGCAGRPVRRASAGGRQRAARGRGEPRLHGRRAASWC